MQTGFPSHADAGSRPDAPGEVTDLAVQQRILALLDLELDALAREERVAGLYLWKWDPDPRGGGAGHAGFTPQGKPAEAVLPGLLSK